MWIKSQYKTFITEMQTIAYYKSYEYVDQHTPKKIIHELRNYSEYFLDEVGRIIGTFPTKEGALAELDNLTHWAGCGGIGVYQVSKP